MSSRKTNIVNSTFIANSRSTTRNRINLNATNFSINRTVSSSSGSLTTTDWELECDLAYSDYLQAFTTQKLLEEKIKKQTVNFDQQLSWQSKKISSGSMELNQTNRDVAKLKFELNSAELNEKIQRVNEIVTEAFFDCNMGTNLNKLICYLANKYMTFKFEHIQPITTQEKSDQLVKTIENCTNTLKKIKQILGNTEVVEEFANALEEFTMLKNEVTEKINLVVEQQNNLNRNVIMEVSNQFANLRNIDQETLVADISCI